MRRNVAGQFIGSQMITAADGTAFTGSVTVYVTGDAGTQALGSVGSGVCAHEGNGFHTYAPAQAETNYTHVGFTFIGTGAIPATVQVFPTVYDANGRADVGAVGGTSQTAGDLAALITTVDTVVDGIQTDLDNGTDGLGAIKAETALILADTGTDGVVVNAAGLATDAVNEIADGILTRNVSNTEATAAEHTLCTVVLAMLENSISGTTLTIKRTDGTTTHATKTLTLDAAADPITGVN